MVTSLFLLLAVGMPLSGYALTDSTATAIKDTAVIMPAPLILPVGIVDEKPVFEDEQGNDFLTYIVKNMKYPAEALEGVAHGTVYVEFIVDTNGWITHAKVVRGINPALDEEALRVLITAPNWQPGKHQGKPVNVRYIYPVFFN